MPSSNTNGEAKPDYRAMAEQMRELAFRDPLTGLLNRRGFDEELRRIWGETGAACFPLGLMIIDIDHFKAINDSHGHFVGDQVLKECSQLIEVSVREGDTVCRYYGGDEMVVILPRASRDEMSQVASRLEETFRTHPVCRGTYDLSMTLSIGACHVPGHTEPTADRYLIQADRALYRAKQTGRNRVCFADDLPDGLGGGGDVSTPLAAAPAGMADSRRTILVADDDGNFCLLLKHCLDPARFNVLVAQSGEEAIEMAEQHRGLIDVALVDYYLGLDFAPDVLERLRQMDENLACIVITGGATVTAAVEAMRNGAIDFIEKPIYKDHLNAVIERALKYRGLMLQNSRYQSHLEKMVREKNAALSRALDSISDTFQFTLEAITDILDAREQKTGEHSRRVARLSVVHARELGAMPEEIQTIETGALLHDIGKIGIPDSILLKPGALTADEKAVMSKHPEIGYNIIKAGPGLEEVSEIVLAHHERHDGSGYPRGLRGEDICLGARIFAVVDTYDAIRSDRPYSKGRSPQEGVSEIVCNRGTLFDPAVVDAFLRCHGEIEKVGRWT